MRVDFILSKDPATEDGGDVAMTKLVMALARDSFTVRGLALSRDVTLVGDDICRTEKPRINGVALIARSVGTRKSLIHCRFDTPGMAKLIADSPADRFVAEHSYMAEPYFAARQEEAGTSLLVNSHVSESEVWQLTKSPALQWEHRRLELDERSVAIRARSVAYFDRKEAERSPANSAYWLNLTLPSKVAADRAATSKRLVFLGDRSWPPNAEAARRAVELWPRISAGIADAELLLVGKPDPRARKVDLPAGVVDMEFVQDLDVLLSTARALIAPVAAGGGVRVKILEAASIGLPVVGSPAALGSLGEVLPITECQDDEKMVERARAYLLDPALAGASGRELFEANDSRWARGTPHSHVHDWLVGK